MTASKAENSTWIGVVAAYSWEVGPFVRASKRLSPGDVVPKSNVKERNEPAAWASKSGDILLRGKAGERFALSVAGEGGENARSAARRLVDRYPLRCLLSIGFAGGLVPGILAGDVVAATEVLDIATGERFECADGFPNLVGSRTGRLICSPAIVGDSEEKLRVGQQWDAVAVDMESAAVARVARDSMIPFRALKSISDTAEESLSIDFSRCRREDNGLSVWAVLLQGLSSLERLRALCRLGWNSRKASIALANALLPR